MKIKDLINVNDSMKNLARTLLTKSTDNYKVYKIYSKIREELNNYYTQRDKIVMKYGTKNENGTVGILSDNPNFQKAIKDISELEEIEVDITIETLKLNVNDLNLSAIDIYNLVEFKIIELENKISPCDVKKENI